MQQNAPTKKIEEQVYQFLEHVATPPGAIIGYCASDMVLNMHSDASYLYIHATGKKQSGGTLLLGVALKK